MSEMPDRWFAPQGSKRYHYFDADLRSLCRKWMLWADPGTIEGVGWGTGEGYDATGDCAECKRRLAKLPVAS